MSFTIFRYLADGTKEETDPQVLFAERDALRARIAELEGALREIAGQDVNTTYTNPRAIARAALAPACTTAPDCRGCPDCMGIVGYNDGVGASGARPAPEAPRCTCDWSMEHAPDCPARATNPMDR